VLKNNSFDSNLPINVHTISLVITIFNPMSFFNDERRRNKLKGNRLDELKEER
jgi:hypothetical protein